MEIKSGIFIFSFEILIALIFFKNGHLFELLLLPFVFVLHSCEIFLKKIGPSPGRNLVCMFPLFNQEAEEQMSTRRN